MNKNKILESYLSNTAMNPFESLSNRELEITSLLIKGQGNLEISSTLNIK